MPPLWPRSLLGFFSAAALLAPAPAHAEPPGPRVSSTSATERQAPRLAKLAPVEDKSGALPEATPRRTRPDVCELLQPEAKSVTLRTHRIERGDSLSGIAWRYGTSVKALAAANGLTEDQKIRTGQELVIPQHSRPGGGDDWLRYAAPPKQRGQLDLMTHNSRYRGQVIEGGRVLPAAREEISTLLGAHGTRPALSERLIRLLVRVSDTFGGRTVRVVSGYRSSSYYVDSRHKRSEAVDFSIPGVPNAVLRQYLLLLDDVGVGYYPNSSFLHLDVRGCAMQWVDYAGPGEAPRRSPRKAPRRMTAGRSRGAPRMSDLDVIAEKVAAAMAEASKPDLGGRPKTQAGPWRPPKSRHR
jgi:LysM repeat protein